MPEDKRQILFDLVEKYSKALPKFKPSVCGRANGSGDVILLTGSTGSLGSNILGKLLVDRGVHLVYCISRPSSDGVSVEERHRKAFDREGLDQGLLNSDRVRLLEGDPSLPDLGLQTSDYEEASLFILSSSSMLTASSFFLRFLILSITVRTSHLCLSIYCHYEVSLFFVGWRVNFDLAVTSFESNIRSVRNFINFALTSRSGVTPPRIIFISSIGVFSSTCFLSFSPTTNIDFLLLTLK